MIRLNDIIDEVKTYHTNADIELIQKAYVYIAKNYQGKVRISGEPYLSHPLEVAYILSQMRLDVLAITAGLLHDVTEYTNAEIKDIADIFGSEVGAIVEGVTKISQLGIHRKQSRQAEAVRKMIVAMATDIRVLLVQIADRLHTMRTLGDMDEGKQQLVARETQEIYAPLAGRLGLHNKKSELEDLAFFYLENDKYREIRDGIALKDEDRQKYSSNVRSLLETLLEDNAIEGRVKGRLKHTYSIYQKMLIQSLSFAQIYDLIAFRIIVRSVRDCYAMLGIIHNKWMPVPGRFKDYIAMPKSNMYQSLHTTVTGPYGERMEVQIRTDDMDRVAEEGIAAHWRYKEGNSIAVAENERFSWLRRLLEWMQDTKDPHEFLEHLKIDLQSDEVYVFTPQGDVKALPRGSKPLDFAYAVHTDVGNTCTGAKINGKLVSLKHELKNGELVEVMTNPRSTPGKDWLKLAATPRARAKIRRYFMLEERERSLALGRELVEKELRKHKLSLGKILKGGALQEAALSFSLKGVDDLFAIVGYGKISPKQALSKVLQKETAEEESQTKPKEGELKTTGYSKDAVIVKGLHDVLVRLGKCCNPLPGDDIIGFITRGRGVTIHNISCPLVHDSDPERKVEAEWELGIDGMHPARVRITSEDRPNLLSIISNLFGKTDSNIIRAKMDLTEDQKAVFDFTVEVRGREHLDTIIASLKRIKEIIKIERIRV